MRAAYYERNGAARDVLRVGEVDTPMASAGEVRVKLATSGVNPSDVKSRAGATRKITWPRLIPQSDGAGVIDQVGDGVPKSRIGERVWVWNGQWRRAFGTAAEYITLPSALAVPLPEKRELRGRRLPRHPGHDRDPRGGAGADREGHDVAGLRRRRLGEPIRHPIRQSQRRARHHHGVVGREGGGRARSRRRPHHRLQARGRHGAGDGDHRQARRRRGDRNGLRRQRSSAARRAAARRAASSSTAPAAR